MKKSNHIQKNKVYYIYTGVFVVLCFIVFFIFIKNGKSFIWKTDGYHQHYAILYDFNEIVRNIFKNGFSMISWNMGLGLDVIGQYSYYIIGDLFAYISLLFPMDYLEVIYNLLIVARIYFVGIAFIAYAKYNNKENINILIGAIIYSFCGFIIYAGIRHPYFTNATILLPINLLAIDKFLKENKKTFLIGVVFITVFSNYYFFYMIAIISMLYMVIKYICEFKEGIKDFIKKGIVLGVCYLIGILMASAILFPTVYAFFNSPRTGVEQINQYCSGYFSSLFLGLISMRFKNWSVICVSSLILLMLPVVFSKLKNNKEAKSYAFMFILTSIMLLFPLIASFMNGLSFPSNRWVFAYSFILSYIITIGFHKNLKYTKKQIILMFVIIVLYNTIGVCITKLNIKENLDFYVCGLISLGFWILILLNNINIKFSALKYSYLLVIFLIIANISINAMALYSKHGKDYASEFIDYADIDEKYATLNNKMNGFKEAIQYIKDNDSDFYRITKNDSSNCNISLIYNYNPVQTYLSIGNGDVYELSSCLQDNKHTSTRCINGMDRRTKINTLLGSKYFICSIDEAESVPYGYELYYEIGEAQIYINTNYLSIGLVYNSYITYEEFEKLTPIQKEDVFLKTAVVEKDINNVKKEENILSKISQIEELSYVEKSDKIKNNQIETYKNNENIILQIKNTKPDTELYLSIKNLKYENSKVKKDFKITTHYNGIKNSEQVLDKRSSAYYIENNDFLINLGTAKKQENAKLKITFNNKGTYSFDNLEILAIDMQSYNEKVNLLREKQMTDVVYGNNYIGGKINTNKNGIVQITTSYSDGWRVFVDGEEAEIIKVNKGFIGTFVEAGEHEIRFEYKSPYIDLGIFFSIMGFICFICITIFEKLKKNK